MLAGVDSELEIYDRFFPEVHLKELKANSNFNASTIHISGRTYIDMKQHDILTVYGISLQGDAAFGRRNATADIGWVPFQYLTLHHEDQKMPNPGEIYFKQNAGIQEPISFTGPFQPQSLQTFVDPFPPQASVRPFPAQLLQTIGSASAVSAYISTVYPSPPSVQSVGTPGGDMTPILNSPLDQPTVTLSPSGNVNSISMAVGNVVESANTLTSSPWEAVRSGGPALKDRTISNNKKNHQGKRETRLHIDGYDGQNRFPFTDLESHGVTVVKLLDVLEEKYPGGSVFAAFSESAGIIALKNVERFKVKHPQNLWRIYEGKSPWKKRFVEMQKRSFPQILQKNASQALFLELLLMLNDAVSKGESTDHLLDIRDNPTLIAQATPGSEFYGNAAPNLSTLPSTSPEDDPAQFEETVPTTFPPAYINPRSRELPSLVADKKKTKRKIKIERSWIKDLGHMLRDKMGLKKKRTVKNQETGAEHVVEHVDIPVPLIPKPAMTAVSNQHGTVPDNEHSGMHVQDTSVSAERLLSSVSEVLRLVAIKQTKLSKNNRLANIELVSECSEKIYNIISESQTPQVAETVFNAFVDNTVTNSRAVRLFARILKLSKPRSS
ncbi:hypothetical protein BJ742DRAFT_199258 [Cladochytrium replicatum]|nr:hypothetical protein BJ742DRAFT_199258 [Cladochytrium replicatum]